MLETTRAGPLVVMRWETYVGLIKPTPLNEDDAAGPQRGQTPS